MAPHWYCTGTLVAVGVCSAFCAGKARELLWYGTGAALVPYWCDMVLYGCTGAALHCTGTAMVRQSDLAAPMAVVADCWAALLSAGVRFRLRHALSRAARDAFRVHVGARWPPLLRAAADGSRAHSAAGCGCVLWGCWDPSDRPSASRQRLAEASYSTPRRAAASTLKCTCGLASCTLTRVMIVRSGKPRTNRDSGNVAKAMGAARPRLWLACVRWRSSHSPA